MRFENERTKKDCARARCELPALLYGELGPSERLALERHLEACPACRDELARLAEGRALLAHWQVRSPVQEDPRRIAAAVIEQARVEEAARAHGRRRWLAPRWLTRTSAGLCGTAAALVLALALFNAEIDVGQGRCSIAFRLPGAAPAVPVESWPASWEARAREIAASEFLQQAARFRQGQDERLAGWARQNQVELLRLAQATDLARSEDQKALGAVLDAVTREAALEDLKTREALVRLASYVERSPR